MVQRTFDCSVLHYFGVKYNHHGVYNVTVLFENTGFLFVLCIKCYPKIPKISVLRRNWFYYRLMAPGSAACILCEPACDLALC
jgi:hypothetical protein